MKVFSVPVAGNVIGKKALVLSDLHILKSKDKIIIEKLKKYICNNHYNYIYLVGDIIDSIDIFNNKEMKYYIFDFIEFLGNNAPTYIVLGNHDVGYLSNGRWNYNEEIFKTQFYNYITNFNRVYILQNETKYLGDNYTISGINPNIEYINNNILNEKNYNFLKNLKNDNINTVLCHYPNVFLTLDKKSELKNVNLCIAGHTHNGLTQIAPLESFLKFMKIENRGIITPEKSIKFSDTKYLRGVIKLNNSKLVINPACKSLTACNGILEKFNGLFYQGISEIEYKPQDKIKNLK